MYDRMDWGYEDEATVGCPKLATALAVMAAAGFGANAESILDKVFNSAFKLVVQCIDDEPTMSFKSLVWSLLSLGGGDEARISEVDRRITLGMMVARFDEKINGSPDWTDYDAN